MHLYIAEGQPATVNDLWKTAHYFHVTHKMTTALLTTPGRIQTAHPLYRNIHQASLTSKDG